MKDLRSPRKADVIIVVGGTLFLLMNIAAFASAGRRRAKAIVCLANLHQWGGIFEMFTKDNDGYFSEGFIRYGGWLRGEWIIGLRPYIQEDTNLLRCPEAVERHPKGYMWGGPFNSYLMPPSGSDSWQEECSYGANCWIYNPRKGFSAIQGRPTEWNWRSVAVQGADNIPVFADSMFRGGGPCYRTSETGALNPGFQRIRPPDYDGQWINFSNEMMHFCIDRHDGAINVLFMDWSVKKIGLKQLWTLKWHRQFNTAGPWTIAGGVRPSDWPQWMRNFRD